MTTSYQPPAGARTITPGSMEPGDLVSDLDGFRSFRVDQVKPIRINYGQVRVDVWWIMGYEYSHKIQTVVIPRQPFYLIRRGT